MFQSSVPSNFTKSNMAAITMATGHMINILDVRLERKMFRVYIPLGNDKLHVRTFVKSSVTLWPSITGDTTLTNMEKPC